MSTVPTIDGAAVQPTRRRLPDPQFSRLSGLYLWVLLFAFFAVVIPDTFLTETTLKGIAADQAITAVLALAALVPLACGCFDISVAQMLGTSAIVCGALMSQADMSPAAAILITLAMGAGFGAINGLIVAYVGVDSLIATLGTSSVLLAVTGWVSDYQFIGPFPESFKSLVAGETGGVPTVIIHMVVIAAIAWYLLDHTPAGRRLYATGAGRDAARLAGIRTQRYVFGSLVVSSVLAAAAGIMLAAKIGQVAPTVGPQYLLPAFAACFLGTTQLKPGRFNVLGTLLALYLLATGVTGLQLIGGELWITDLFNGIALIVAVSAAVIATRRKSRRQQLAATEA